MYTFINIYSLVFKLVIKLPKKEYLYCTKGSKYPRKIFKKVYSLYPWCNISRHLTQICNGTSKRFPKFLFKF